MTEDNLKELLIKIQEEKMESSNLELKAAKDGCPKKLYDTISSFSNQDDGGIILFGVDESNDYEECGVYDVNDIQKQINNQCLQMHPKVRPILTVVEKEGKYFVAAEIPSIDIAERPCYYEGVGRLKGSYIRVGDSDEHMTEYEIYSFEAFRQKYQDDIRVISRASEQYINKKLLNEYLDSLKDGKPNLSAIGDNEIKSLMGLESDGELTLSTVMIFGVYPQAYFPQLTINAVVVPGVEIGDINEEGERFIDNHRIDGNIQEMLENAISFVRRNMKNSTVIDPETGKRIDKTQYPIIAVREALLNALVHRDYSIHTEGMPIQLLMFDDRIEIRNPGGLYGRMTVDQLGKVQPDTRNPVLVNILEVLNVTENRYSGIPTIKRTMREHGLSEPEFKVERGTFVTVLYNSNRQEKYIELINNIHDKEKSDAFVQATFGTGKSLNSIAQFNAQFRLLQFLEVERTRKEIAEFVGMDSVSYALKKYIEPLVEEGKVEMTIPDKPKSKKQRYRIKR